jgi:inner membrane transporter RhtA
VTGTQGERSPERWAGTAPALVLASLLGLQGGAAVATSLHGVVGAAGVVTLRLCVAALVLGVLLRPSLRLDRRRWLLCLAVGLLLCAHHLSFYTALARLGLGTTTTVEFLGPFGIALVLSRTRTDVVWALLAVAGVTLVARPEASSDVRGLAWAAAASLAFAGYILAGGRLARALPGGHGLALAVAVGAVTSLPLGLAAGGPDLLRLPVLAVGAAVAVPSTVVPYLLQMHAMRRLDPRLVSLLLCAEPAVAAVTGLVLLGQHLTAGQWAGVLAVVLTSAAATLTHARAGAPVPR